jgi:predicted 3-demethylubiquinone-9 3-methyltransferase (glyoxalase superfamily)
MQKITPFLWFVNEAEEAVNFYVSLFKDARIVSVTRYGEAAAKAAGRPEGSVMTIEFQLAGQTFVALNGGPVFTFSPAISLLVNCETQEEIDELWERLSAGGEKGECGWLKDRFGVSWQIAPARLAEMLQDQDPQKTERVMQAMLHMKKIELEALEWAYGD